MNTIEQTIQRIIDQEIYVNASTMVADLIAAELSETMPATFEKLLECSSRDDWETPVRDAIADITPADLYDVCFMFDIGCKTKDGVLIDSEEEAEEIDNDNMDRESVLEAIEDEDNWQEIGEHLDLEPDVNEALQHWLVSDWLADELEAVNAPVTRDLLGFNVWGRTECGQSLTMDSALNAVARNFEARLSDITGRN